MRIDAHQHYWKIDRGDYGWIAPDIPVLYRDFLPHDLSPNLKRHQIDGSIVVQAAPTLAETEYILSLAEGEPSILGVVGWLDLNDPAYKEHCERFSSHAKFVGFRVMVQEMPDAYAILEPHFVEAMAYFAKQATPVDILVASSQLDPLVELLERVPGLRAVIDHIAKPNIAEGAMEPWRSRMHEIAKHSNVFCKLSGMVTEADQRNWELADFTPYIREIVGLFGPDRVMFGSDWPVCLIAADYDQVMDVLVQALPAHWTEEERNKLFGLNAKRFYKL